MIKLGEWLEVYLNPDIKPREYRELAEKFITLYDVNFEIKPVDLSFKFFSHLDKQDEDTREYYQTGWRYEGEMFNLMDPIKKEKDPLKTKAFLTGLILGDQADLNEAAPVYYQYGPREFEYENIDKFAETTAKFLINLAVEKKFAFGLLQEVARVPGTPWVQILLFYYCDRTALFQDYSKIGEKVTPSKAANCIKIQRTFVAPPRPYVSRPPQNISVFPWNIALSRVFFDFLQLGGRDRISFCKQCGRFTVIKRKGRKEYCSSLCRVRASNERIAQAGA